MIRLTLTLCALLACSQSFAAKSYGNLKLPSSAVTSIYDADTFTITVPGWPAVAGERISVRINGIDAPEMKSKCKTADAKSRERRMAQKAKQFTVGALRQTKELELRNIKRGKYFRLLADVYVDGHNLAAYLIEKGQARPYHGGKRKDWCKG